MSLLIHILRTIAGAMITPPLAFVLIILGAILYRKNKKIASMEKMILGGSVNSVIELTLSQLVLGTVCGIVGSLMLAGLGIAFSETLGITCLFLYL